MRGRHTALRPRLTLPERRRLLRLRDAPETPPGVVRRVRLILQVANGLPISWACASVHLSRVHAYKWLKRWQDGGEDGLEARPVGRKAVPPPPFRYQLGQRVQCYGQGWGRVNQRRRTERPALGDILEYLVTLEDGTSDWWYEPDVLGEGEAP